MRLSDVEIIKLLPSWMRIDDADIGLSIGSDKVTREFAALIQLLSRWNRIDEMSESELDEMAWDLNIIWYSSTASIETKRNVVKNSDKIYARLGTKWAVEQIISDYFGSAKVLEWWEYGGEPFYFKILSDNPDITDEDFELFMYLLNFVKRKSAHLETILIGLTGYMNVYWGMGARMHDHEVNAIGLNEL